MRRISIHTLPRAFALLAIVALLATGAQAADVLGEWKLVEQSYGKGQANLVDPSEPALHVAFARNGGNVQGSVRVGSQREQSYSWPSVANDGSRTIQIEEIRLRSNDQQIFARYKVDPSPGDDLVLRITESYELSPAGDTLTGTVLVEFIRDGNDRGSYTMHRTFERQAQ